MARPLARRISDIRIARTIEERYPQLQDRLVTATELTIPGRPHFPSVIPFLPLLLRDAARQLRIGQTFGEIFNRREPLQSVLVSCRAGAPLRPSADSSDRTISSTRL